jgi:DNA-binding MarR family transcriptional regulator
MSGRGASSIFELKNVTAVETLVLAFLASKLGQKDFAWPSQSSIATGSKLSVRSVLRSMKALEGRGYISRARRHRADGSRSSDICTLLCVQRGFVEQDKIIKIRPRKLHLKVVK